MSGHHARRGSMQFWPRKRALRQYAHVKSWPQSANKILCFAAYKVGMTHLLYTDAHKFSQSKGQDITIPVTILECPPLKVAAVKFYAKDAYGLHTVAQVNASKVDAELSRTIPEQKKQGKNMQEFTGKLDSYEDIRLVVYTQPKLTTIGKKKPELFEVGLGGTIQDKFALAIEKLGKEILITDVFKEGELVDVRGITKGKGLQGPVKRFGVSIRQHKAEKTKRGPATLGPWNPHNGNYRVPHQGQMGYHQRTELNKWIVKIGADAKEANQKGGFIHYGIVKNQYLFIKGSVAGPAKRMLMLTAAQRKSHKTQSEPANVQYVALAQE